MTYMINKDRCHIYVGFHDFDCYECCVIDYGYALIKTFHNY